MAEYETTSEPSEPQRKSVIPWIILVVLVVLLCCCCAFILSGWLLGDIVLQTIEEILGGYYY